MWAVLWPGETYHAPMSSVYIHFCEHRTDAVAYVSLAFGPHEAKALCPGAAVAELDAPVKMIGHKELGFPGLICDFPFSYNGVAHSDCFEREGEQGTWCVS